MENSQELNRQIEAKKAFNSYMNSLRSSYSFGIIEKNKELSKDEFLNYMNDNFFTSVHVVASRIFNVHKINNIPLKDAMTFVFNAIEEELEVLVSDKSMLQVKLNE